jgi:hypothetical protein
MNTELWKDVIGLDGVYSISNFGRVRRNTKRTNSVPGAILKPWCSNGYPHVGLWNNGVQTRITVHRLVAIAFIPNPLNLPEVNHKNGIKSDNLYSNLEWASHARNTEHAFQTGLISRKLTRDNVVEIQKLRTAKPLMGLKAIARKFGITHGHVTSIWRDDNFLDRFLP